MSMFLNSKPSYQHFRLSDSNIKVFCDNTVAITYICEMGGTKSLVCYDISTSIWDQHVANNASQNTWQYVADYGTPRNIVMDNRDEVTSRDFQDFCRRHTITTCYTTPHHPQGKGITERMHRTLKSVLAALCQGPSMMAQTKSDSKFFSLQSFHLVLMMWSCINGGKVVACNFSD